MGETRALPSHLNNNRGSPVYPGLVRPYAEDLDYVNQPKYTVDKMYQSTQNNAERPCSTSDHDPFSIYDDETAHDHYFFLPAGQPEVKRTCSQGEKSGRWSRNKPLIDKRTKPPDIRSQRANTCPSTTDTTPSCHCPVMQKNDAQQNARNSRRAPNRTTSTTTGTPATSTTTTTTNQRHSLKTKDVVYGGGGGGGRGSSMSGDYCSLSVHAVAPHYPTMIRSQRDPPIDEDKFRKFAHNLIRTTNVDSRSDINKNQNDYCKTSSGETMEMYDLDRCIDSCTCMMCVKAGRYHWAGDGDSFIEEPCNCVGARKNIVRRWLCMGVLALFLPCLICYLPAKLCQKSCASKHCVRGKLGDGQQHTVVKYVDGGCGEVKLQPTGLL